ncbi:MAG: DUF4215 domain-containing protein [Myxococcota bacterium]
MTRPLRLGLLVLLPLFGCELFPKNLILSDQCSADLPVIPRDGFDVVVDLTGFRNDISDRVECLNGNTPGPDGFFAVDMRAGEKWHFHVRNTLADGLNPAIYVLDSNCDQRTCGEGEGIDLCGDNRDEHLSFVADRDGIFVVGIDSRDNDPGMYELLAVRPVCGDNNVEHSETCDDGNLDPGDGCDELCRHEISDTRTEEREPNDDNSGANVVDLSGGSAMANARLANECDPDRYLLSVPAGAIDIELRADGGGACSAESGVTLTVENSAGRVVATGAPEGDGVCPVLRATDLPAESYVVVATEAELDRPFDYALAFTVP